MRLVQRLPSEEPDVNLYAPILWFVVGLLLGWLLCKGGVG
jgi:hypothetical protein